MRLAFIVTEFPKFTETFIARDLVEFGQQGHEIRIYHLTRFRQHEIVHEFAKPTLSWARSRPYVVSRDVLSALFGACIRRPATVIALLMKIGASYWKHPAILAKSLALFPKSLWIAKELTDWDTDHVHAEFAGHPGTCAWIVGRMTGLPYSVTCRAHDIFRTQAMLDEKLSRASFVRTISDYNKSFLQERVPGLRNRPIEVIHSSLDVHQCEAFERPDGEIFRVLFVGALRQAKGVDVLLRALGRSPALGEWSCEIIGDGTERPRMERLAQALNLNDRIVFRGKLPNEQVLQALRGAHVLVIPSVIGLGKRREGIPNVAMEALAHQRPVVASRLSGIPELIEDEKTGYLVPPGDDQALARVLEKVHREPEAAYLTAKRGREQVIAGFDLKTNALRQLRLFERFRAKRSHAV